MYVNVYLSLYVYILMMMQKYDESFLCQKSLHRGKWKSAELELVRENDLGDDQAPVLETVTHLAGILKEGDMVLGYDLHQLSTHNDLLNDINLKHYLKKHKMPDVIVIKKHYPYYPKSMKRKWKLKSMVKERDYNVDKYAAEREKIDNEIFMREVERDFDLRCQIKVYKDHEYQPQQNDNNNFDDELPPQIPDSELIDEFSEMKIQDNGNNNNDNNGNNGNINNVGNNNDNDNDNTMIDID